MPYITKERREVIDNAGCVPASAGELNYAITRLVTQYLKVNYVYPTYSGINEVIGVLECAKLELYRRVAAPYESTKLAQNGDVYS